MSYRELMLIAAGLFFAGCVTTGPLASPPPSIPLVEASQSPASAQHELNLKSSVGPVQANATIVRDSVFVHVSFQNTSSQPVPFGPEQITLADAENTLLRSLSPSDVMEPFYARTSALQVNADRARAYYQQMTYEQDQRDHAEHERHEENGQNSRVPIAEGIAYGLEAIGELAQISTAENLQSAERASEIEVGALERRIDATLLSEALMPPGTKNEGWTYFAKPERWPVTLRILIDGHVMDAVLQPSPGSPTPALDDLRQNPAGNSNPVTLIS